MWQSPTASVYGGIAITAGSSGDTICTDEVVSGISVHGAANTVITSNTVWGSTTPLPPIPIAISSSSTGTTIENNIVIDIRPAPTPAVSYTVNWGDGTTSAPTPASATEADTAMTHTYAKIGTYTITDTAALTDGSTVATAATFTTAGAGYTASGPTRMLDTRNGTGAAEAKIAADSGVPVSIAGLDGIPEGVTAVAVHVTVTDTDTAGNGWIAAEADGAGTPGTSSLNYLKGQTVANTVIVPVAADGKIELYNGGGTTPVDLITDVSGYFAPTATEVYVPITPSRDWDSRQDYNALPANGSLLYELDIPSCSPYTIPADSSVITNITLTDETANGFITAYPYGTPKPATSNLNYLKGQNVAGLSIPTGVDTPNYISVYNESAGTSDIILGVFGYFANSWPARRGRHRRSAHAR